MAYTTSKKRVADLQHGREPRHCRSYHGGFPVVRKDVSRFARIDLIDRCGIIFSEI